MLAQAVGQAAGAVLGIVGSQQVAHHADLVAVQGDKGFDQGAAAAEGGGGFVAQLVEVFHEYVGADGQRQEGHAAQQGGQAFF